ncbi:MAG: YfhO family protein [Prevotellaceae bacterium]|nr:YfhO family protein [Prevotellaceae bacterium]
MALKRILPDVIAIVAFMALSFVYFFPADIEHRILFQNDTAAGAGAGHEIATYYEQTGERSRWTNALFGGMPTYQISPSYDSNEPLRWTQKVYRLFLPSYVQLSFIMLLGFYILLRAFGMPAGMAALGGIVWAFSSYFFILISAGHIWKFVTLAYIPPTLAGLVWAYRGRYLAGGVVTALFIALQIMSNHLQMSYYFLLVILFFVIAFFVEAWKKKQMPRFWRATGVLAIAAVIGVAANLSNLYHTYTYSKQTMRGPNELTAIVDAAKPAGGGLDRDYITQWSYGIGETWTLLIPNYKGGASVPLSQNPTAMAKANPMYAPLYSQLGQYFGEQPMTSGPVYVGAFVLFLFFIGCFIVKGPMKWALLLATLFSILLSWGKNFMPLTDFFIDYIPMYNKFRAVSSILVIAQFTIPLLAMMALWQLLAEPAALKRAKPAVIVALVVTAGVSLLYALSPGAMGNTFVPSGEAQLLQNAVDRQIIPAEELTGILANLGEMRAALVSGDAVRSLVIVLIGVALLWFYAKGRLRKSFTLGGIVVLCLIDLWTVDKRYLDDSQFVPASTQTDSFAQTDTDKQILQDTTPDYRVLNLASNTFNENNTAYWHKSVGGYHAAKLQRYQDLIDRHIAPEMQTLYSEAATASGIMALVDGTQFPVLNMLNTKYFIFPVDKQGNTVPIENPYALGNAWFVHDVDYVESAASEIDALGNLSPLESAVADARFKATLHGLSIAYKDSMSTIRLTGYAPNRVRYETENGGDGIALFSEIYYPDGWQATIDGKQAQIGRADYVLRAMYIPKGKHTVEMRFDPKSLHVTECIAYIALALLLMGAVAAIVLGVRRNGKVSA